MTPKELLCMWIDAFNAADADLLASLYDDNAVNHQVSNEPVVGKAAIHAMFQKESATAKMLCIVENIFTDGQWAIMERPFWAARLRVLPSYWRQDCFSKRLLG